MFGGVARRGRHSAALVVFHNRLKRDGDGPTWADFRELRLVNPRAGNVQPVRKLAACAAAQCGCRAGGQTGFGHSFQHNILDAKLAAEVGFGWRVSVFVHHVAVGVEAAQLILEIEYPTAAVNPCIGYVTN